MKVPEHTSFHSVFEFKQVYLHVLLFKIMYTSKVLKQQNSLVHVVFLASGPTCGLLSTLTPPRGAV